MLGIGTSELVIIFAVVLIVFGPKRIPELARYIGKATKMFKEASQELQRQLEMSEWDKSIQSTPPPSSKKNASESTSTQDDSPYEYDDSGNYENYGYPENWSGEDEKAGETEPAPVDDPVIKAEAEVDEDVDPAKVEDAERADRELHE
jgi:sec-independent protein translocase protein TatA